LISRENFPNRAKLQASEINGLQRKVQPALLLSRDQAGGPVGALVEALCKSLREFYDLRVITNDIYTEKDQLILTRAGAGGHFVWTSEASDLLDRGWRRRHTADVFGTAAKRRVGFRSC
jgi:hypothetical protein